jgi:hypothetical protein
MIPLCPLRSYNIGMAKVKVYHVKVYDPTSDQWSISPRMATREGVAIMNGKIIEGSETETDESQLEHGEQWTPRNFTP